MTRLPEEQASAPAASGLTPDDLFAGFEGAGALLLAVSGGPDSMALLHLAARWTGGRGAPHLHTATVDHRLRPEARDEAILVAAAAAARGLSHAVLPWLGPKPSAAIQEKARAARYALLADHARSLGVSTILTAHHADDQAETVLLRLARGSGITGLAGMRRTSALAHGLVLGRPLLGLPKAELVAICLAEGLAFANDPSNVDPVYARARLRREAAALAAGGLDTAGVTRFASRMARADTALESEAARLEAVLAVERDVGSVRVHLEAARGAQTEIVLRLLRRAIEHVAPERAFIRLDRLEDLTAAIEAALRHGRSYKATLGGGQIVLARDSWLTVSRERPRRRGLSPSG